VETIKSGFQLPIREFKITTAINLVKNREVLTAMKSNLPILLVILDVHPSFVRFYLTHPFQLTKNSELLSYFFQPSIFNDLSRGNILTYWNVNHIEYLDKGDLDFCQEMVTHQQGMLQHAVGHPGFFPTKDIYTIWQCELASLGECTHFTRGF
jgi:hypothetical protein